MDEYIEKNQRTLLIIGVAVIVALVVLVCALNVGHQTRYTFAGERLTLVSVGGGEVVMRDGAGREARYHGSGEMSYFLGYGEVTYGERTFSRNAVWGEDETVHYVFSDGSSLTEELIFFTVDGDTPPVDVRTRLQQDEMDLLDRMMRYLVDGNPTASVIGRGIFAALVGALGVAFICYPRKFWRWQTMFTVQGGEPTDWAIVSNRIGGVLLIVVGLVLAAL